MKSVKSLTYLVAVAALLTVGLTAGGKKSDDNLRVGSLVSDGNNVTSNFLVSGYPVNLSINNIVTAGGGYGYGYGTSSLAFTITVNGQVIPVQTNAQFYMTGTTQRGQASTYNNLQVIYSAACYDQACSTVAVEAIFGTGYEYRQIVIKKSMTEGKIKNMGEYSVTVQTVQPLNQIMMTL